MTIALRPAEQPRARLLLSLSATLAAAVTLMVVVMGGLAMVPAVTVAPVGPVSNGLLTFESEGDIHSIDPGGSGRWAVVATEAYETSPSWSWDGQRLAYLSGATSTGPFDLRILDKESGETLTVATGIDELHSWAPALQWSPDDTLLLFAARMERPGDSCPRPYQDGDFCSSRIFVVATDGSDAPTQLGDPELDARSPAWSPDGTRIAFGGGDAAEAVRLMVMDADGSNVRSVGDTFGTNFSFARVSWSPDGSRIAAQVGGRYAEIYEWDVESGAERNLSNTPFDEIGPTYAFDGALAWETEVPGEPCCMMLLEPGKSPVRMPGRFPMWSPDGHLIATFMSDSPDLILVSSGRDGIVQTIPDAAWPPSWQRLAP